MSDKAIGDLKLMAWFLLIMIAIQGPYNLFEAVRHAIMDGWDDHARSHFTHSLLPFFLLIMFRQLFFELIYLWWEKRK